MTQSVAAPAPARAAGSRGARGPLVAGAWVAAATALVALRDPHVTGSYGVCPLRALTGLYCPACGGLRATYDLAHLHLATAWSENALWVVLAPLAVAAWLVVVVRRARGRAVAAPPAWLGWVGLAVVAAFGVLRNLPPFGWLAP